MQNDRGFSLIELLIVVVIIGVVAAIAIPNMLASRRAANEGATASAMRTLYSADVSYAASLGNGSYAGVAGTVGTSSMAELQDANLVDSVLGAGLKSGYLLVGDRPSLRQRPLRPFILPQIPRRPPVGPYRSTRPRSRRRHRFHSDPKSRR